jgi:small subunit ribosomal protein S21
MAKQVDGRIELTGSKVTVWNDNVEKAVRQFKKKIADSGKLQELREREFYEKPTTTRKKKKASAERRWRKQLTSQALPKKLY